MIVSQICTSLTDFCPVTIYQICPSLLQLGKSFCPSGSDILHLQQKKSHLLPLHRRELIYKDQILNQKSMLLKLPAYCLSMIKFTSKGTKILNLFKSISCSCLGVGLSSRKNEKLTSFTEISFLIYFSVSTQRSATSK